MSPDEDELYEVLQSVRDEETFLQFLLALRDDREASIALEKMSPSSPYGPDARGWQNTTIERFFDTAVGLPEAGHKKVNRHHRSRIHTYAAFVAGRAT